jgi:hypothetical protein
VKRNGLLHRHSTLAYVETDALGERKFSAEIDSAGDAAHIAFPDVRAGFAAAARFLLAAKSAANLGA